MADTLAELIAGATDRVEVRTTHARSGARFETLRIGGQPHFSRFFRPPATGSCGASLFASVLAYGVAACAIGMGIVLAMLGDAVRMLDQRTSGVPAEVSAAGTT